MSPPAEAALLRGYGREGARSHRARENSQSPGRGIPRNPLEMVGGEAAVGHEGEDDDQSLPDHESAVFDMYSTACNVLSSLRKEDAGTLRNQATAGASSQGNHSADGHGDHSLEINNHSNFTSEQYKLTERMSKMVKFTNASVNKVIDTLNYTASGKSKEIFKLRAPGLALAPYDTAAMGGDDPEASVLLDRANVSIKNLNHSLMKLVAVQQESVSIPKGLPQGFVMMDRVPTYLEIEAAGMPFPCKIVLRPAPRKYSDAVANLIAQNMVVYLSTKTKNPGERNHQLKIGPPGKKVFLFAPIAEERGGPSKKDCFQDKIHICIAYDVSDRPPLGQDGGEARDENAGANGAEKAGKPSALADQLSHVDMRIHISFPKDKDEIQKRRLHAML